MADTIGSIYVELAANTSQFVSALGTASSQARRAGREIQDSFSSLGSVAETALAPFGLIGQVISETLGKVGDFSGAAIKQFSRFTGGLNGFAVAGGVAVGALAAVEGGAIALAVHTAESADQMGRLAQSTGVNVATLSGLAPLAKLSGLSVSELALSLERLDKSSFAAANSQAGSINAFSRLGVAVRDANGQMRPTIDILGDLAQKFSSLQDGPAKTAEAMAIFGRSGAAMIPLLNEGKAAIQDFFSYASKVGAIVTPDIAANAGEFEKNLVKLQLAGEGLSNTLTAALLPSLKAVTEQLGNAFADKGSDLNGLISLVTTLTKATLVLGESFVYVFSELGSLVRHAAAEVVLLADAMKDIKSAASILAVPATGGASLLFPPKGSDLAASTKANVGNFFGEESQTANSIGAAIDSILTGKLTPAKTPPTGTLATAQPSVLGSGRPDIIDETIRKLEAEAKARLDVASATDRSAAALVIAQAAAKSEQAVTDLQTRLLEKQKALRAELASAQASDAGAAANTLPGGALTQAPQAPRIAAELAETTKQIEELRERAPEIKAAFDKLGSADFIDKAQADLQKFITKTGEETAQANALADAYTRGGDAISNALDSAKLQPEIAALQQINNLIDDLKAIPIPEVQQAVPAFEGIRDQFAGDIQKGKSDARVQAIAEINAAIKKQTDELEIERLAYQALGEAAFGSAAQQRQAAAVQTAARFKEEHPQATEGQLTDVYTNEVTKQQQSYELSIQQRAAESSLEIVYERRVETLRDIQTALQQIASSSTSTSEQQIAAVQAQLSVESELYKATTQYIEDTQKRTFDAANAELEQNASLYESQRSLEEQWIRMADEAGSFGDKVRGVFEQIAIDGQNASGKMAEAFAHAVDSISGELAKIAVTGKGSLTKVFEGLEENVVKVGIQGVIGNAASGIQSLVPGLKIPGLTGNEKKPTGSSNDPIFVKIAGGLSIGGGAGGQGGAGGTSISSLLHQIAGGAPGTTPTFPGPAAFSSTASPSAIIAASSPASATTAPAFAPASAITNTSASGAPATYLPSAGNPFPLQSILGAPLPTTPSPVITAAAAIPTAQQPFTPPEFASLPFTSQGVANNDITNTLSLAAATPAATPSPFAASPAITSTAPAAGLASAAGVPSFTNPFPQTAAATTAPNPAQFALAAGTLGIEASGASRGAKIIAPLAASVLGHFISSGSQGRQGGGPGAQFQVPSAVRPSGFSPSAAASVPFPNKLTPAFASEPTWSAAAEGSYGTALHNEFTGIGRGFENIFHPASPVATPTFAAPGSGPSVLADQPFTPPEFSSLPITAQGSSLSDSSFALEGGPASNFSSPLANPALGSTLVSSTASLLSAAFAPDHGRNASVFGGTPLATPNQPGFNISGGTTFSSPYAGEGSALNYGPASSNSTALSSIFGAVAGAGKGGGGFGGAGTASNPLYVIQVAGVGAGAGGAGGAANSFAKAVGIGGAGGAGGAGGGSAANPLFVTVVGGSGGLSSLVGGGGSSGDDSDSSSGGGGLFGFLGKLFGGGGGGDDSDADSGGGSDFGDFFGGGLASGGDVSPGMAYLVGERGAEVFAPHTAGRIIPNLSPANGGGGGHTYNNVTMNISTPDADSFGRSQSQIMREAQRHLSIQSGRGR